MENADADISPRSKRRLKIFNTLSLVTMAPALGGALYEAGLRVPTFLLLAGVACVIGMCAMVSPSNPRPRAVVTFGVLAVAMQLSTIATAWEMRPGPGLGMAACLAGWNLVTTLVLFVPLVRAASRTRVPPARALDDAGA